MITFKVLALWIIGGCAMASMCIGIWGIVELIRNHLLANKRTRHPKYDRAQKLELCLLILQTAAFGMLSVGACIALLKH